MIRRFIGRRRRGWRGGRDGNIDAARWFQKIADDPAILLPELEPVEVPDLPADFAVAGKGVDADGTPVRVSFSPNSGGDAWLGAVIIGMDIVASGASAGEILAVAPSWNAAARQRLSLASGLGFTIRGVEATSLRAPGGGVEPELGTGPLRVDLEALAATCRQPSDRALFLRAGEILRGLAAKHGGVARGWEGGFEIVVQGRRFAEVTAGESGVELTTYLPQRTTTRLEGERLADVADSLEGAIRKYVNDRRTRNEEEGYRARVLPLLIDALGLGTWTAWPIPGQDRAVVDVLGVDADGLPRVGVCREKMGLRELGEALDTLDRLRANLPLLLPAQSQGVRLENPGLGLAANEIAGAVGRVAAALGIHTSLYEVQSRRGRGVSLHPLEVAAVPAEPVAQRAPRRSVEPVPSPDTEAENGELTEDASGQSEEQATRSRSRSRRRRGGRGSGGRRAEPAEVGAEGADESPKESGEASEAENSGGFDELSFIDLDEEPRTGSRRRSRGGRGRRRGRQAGGDGAGDAEGSDADPTVDDGPKRDVASASPLDHDSESDADADADMDEMLSPLPDEVSEVEDAKPSYEEDEASSGEVAQAEPAPEENAAPTRPRKRSAILAHADRNSVMAAVLLGRDIRLVEGIWVYSQEELMTFFKSVATDLRDDAPIYVIGFTPSPARDVLQAVSLYSDRLTWFDHHDWPPEDAQALRQALGNDSVQLSPGEDGSLSAVLSGSQRRSRFTDKLVDLSAGRFTDHDYEKWGRVWWHRLGEIAGRPGDRRADLEPLLAGRPSDLAKEAARAETPPPPPEVAYVAERDFRLIHFANHSLVVVDPPGALDGHLLGRIARERYSASLSLVRSNEGETWVLTGEELSGRRSLDVEALVDHMATKLKWVEVLSGEDRVARFRIDRVASQPHRLDEVIGMIAMGRSILER